MTTSSGGTPGGGGASTLPQAPPSQGAPLAVYNGGIQDVWDRMRPQVISQLDALVAQNLNNQLYSNSTLTVEVVNANLSQGSDMTIAPGFTQLDTSHLVLRAPVQGAWKVVLAANLRVTLNVGSFSPAIDVPVEIVLDALSLEVDAVLDDSDPTRPVLQRIGQPKVDFTLRIDSTNALAQRLTGVLTAPANWLAQQAISVTLFALLPNLQGIQGIPGSIPGDGAPPLVDSGTQTPFEEVVDNVELKLRRVNQPHGTVLMAAMDTPATDSWLDAYRNGGPGVQGAPLSYGSPGDSAIWTGHYLAAEAYRYAVTGSSLALDNVGHTLKGIGALIDVNGSSGLLARGAAPEASSAGQTIVNSSSGVFRRAQLYGETWVGYQGGIGISRDQYSGVFFGLSVAYELVPPARADCELRIKQMLDYLIAHNWIVDEDRATWNGQNGSRGPTFWAPGSYQQLAFLLIGHRMDPPRYSAALAAAGPLAELAWLSAWTATFGVDHYYKFNLSHIGFYNYFRLETDPTRWQAMRRAYAMQERYVGHHRNPHFDLIQTSIDPSTAVDLYGSSREAMRQFLGTLHRELAPSVIDLSGVTWVTHQQFSYSNTSTGGFTLGGSTVQHPSEPLPMHLRRPSGHFIWQRDPFTPATPNQGNPRSEKPGLDLVLPYWMGRYMGAF
ncbi:MAG: hypothetical protein KDD82_30460 [Planctomycetes bacterium]|nr:hypothetical protein [Planctomycetota bacterium]